MGSLSKSNPNPNPWTPKDCSSGICSIYCPEWCYVVYPPPPPSLFLTQTQRHSSPFQFSPLVVALIGILATALILLTYYTLVSRLCRHTAAPREPPQGNTPQGLDHSLIESITVRKYSKGGGAHARDCSVCLSDFQEEERVRVLPRCNHAFHLPCIDTWLHSNATCPLCRSSVILVSTRAPSASASAC
ncbi:RING-H2 finger protein ATL52 [Cajanus cajan]|uniref:RING-type E3 ubiquitin transferase n=1 Tax=Cajanus cajan TaxID=3821 RepID=A0A151SFK1_CAJCA|nr:RING-H2 finger protein ATL52 [Cajanus cajan]KYP53481.1 RING-H2 finger protein ATL3A [Cajanus cajan]